MTQLRTRVERLEAGQPAPRYYKFFDPRDPGPNRKLHYFRWDGPPSRQYEISLEEYQQATGSTLTEADIDFAHSDDPAAIALREKARATVAAERIKQVF